MKQNFFVTLSETFTALPRDNSEETALDRYLHDFPHALIKEHLTHVPILFQRWWIITCINGHLGRVKKLRKLIRMKRDKQLQDQARLTALLWLGHAERLFEAVKFLQTHFGGHSLKAHTLSPQDLQMGDIVLSYKTGYYLKHSPLSLFIKTATNSSITHVMIACHELSSTPQLLMSDDTTEGLGFLDGHTDQGELFLVLEPLPDPKLSDVFSEIRRYRSIAEAKTSSKVLQKQYGFPEMKCEAACLIGVFYILSGLLSRRPISIANPLKRKSGMFCSEFVDDLFQTAGIQLMPRSEHCAIVGPIEFLYSPKLRLKGIIGDERTIAQAELEVEKQFGVLEKFHPTRHETNFH